MSLLRPNDVHSAIVPLYLVSRMLGLASYKYLKQSSKHPSASSSNTNDVYESERQFRTSKCGVLYTAILLLALLAWLTYSLVCKILYDSSDLKLTYVVTQVMTLCLSAATTVVSLGLELTLNRKRLEKIMLKIAQVDRILMSEANSGHRRMSCFVIFELVLFLLLLGARHGYELWSRGGNHYLNVVVRFIVHFMSTVMIVQFVSFIQVLKQRYDCMNKLLGLIGGIDDRGLSVEQGRVSFTQHRLGKASFNSTVIVPHVDDTPSGPVSGTNSIFISDSEVNQSNPSPSKFPSKILPHDVPNIHTLRYVHTILYDIAGLINSVYGLQILLAMAYIFMSIVKYFHVVMVTNINSNHEQINSFKVNGIFPLVCVVSIHVANLLWVTIACNSACCEAERTTGLVNKLLLIQPLAADTSAELQLFSQQLLHSKLQFTAFGFFHLDFTFLYGFVGGATTYIVILLQFQ